ncbi:helix-turn-helix domain-containing protein, partial [Pseudomonas sp. FIP_A4]|uniref:helix-turn-helix domain-containing protein n=1 Tax=Pseudomonas sp. FIP_A4 TaxID=3070684 RepID=UPI002FD3605C
MPSSTLPDCICASSASFEALSRGLEVLRAFTHGSVVLGNQDIARITGLPKPTVSRLTYTLTRL